MVELAKGVRDFPPEEKILRDALVDNLKSVFETYGYSPFETPSIERLDTLTAKFSAGTQSDAAKEIFKLSDQGNRDLGLRFDLTVPLSRFIAMNPNVKMPFKRYEIGRVFRDGPIKLGRYREFWQCDVDVIGISSMKADAELMLLSIEAFKRLKLDAYMEVNNRKLLYGIMSDCGVPAEMMESVIISIDKIAKYGIQTVEKELLGKGLPMNIIERIESIFSTRGSNIEILEALRLTLKSELALEGLKELDELFSYLNFLESGKILLNISLARGLTYYTGTVFEGFLKDSKVTSSICGGGRYDNMIGLYAQSNRQFPAVGIAFGLEPITDALKLLGSSEKKTVTKLFIIPIGTFKESLQITTQLRDAGLNVEIDLMDRGVSKNLDYANSMKIPFVGFIGEDELKSQTIKLKNMKTGKEEHVTVEKAYEEIMDSKL